MRRRKMNVLRNLQSFSQGFLAVFLLIKFFTLILAAEPGYLDFDNLPDTNFTCAGKVIGGYYADLETSCQMFHVCVIGQGEELMDIKFLCLNGTVFDQETRVCERVDEVDCSKSERFYYLNLELYGNTIVPEDENSSSQTSTTVSTISTTKRASSTLAPTTQTKFSPSTTKAPSTTTRKIIPVASGTTPQPSKSEPEYIEEYYDYLEEEIPPSSRPITSSAKPPPQSQATSQYYQNQQNKPVPYQPQGFPAAPASFKPPSQVNQQQIQKQPTYNVPYNPKQPQQQQYNQPYASKYNQPNYGRPGVTQPMLAEISQPKPFEGYRRQPQPPVSLTFPSYGETNRHPKSVTISYHPNDDDEIHPIERKDTKRSDPLYFSHIEPIASDSDHQQSISNNNTQPYVLGNHTDHSFSVVNESNKSNIDDNDNPNDNYNINEDSQHNVSHNISYEKLLKPQNVYIPNLPKVINTVSVSVSDQNGKKLNLSLENILAEQHRQQQHRSYDDYKEDEISAALLEPFFLDVPKLNIRTNNATR